MIATAVMEISTKSAGAFLLHLTMKRLSELDSCSFPLAYRTSVKGRLHPIRAQEEGSGRPKASSPPPLEAESRRRSSYIQPEKPDYVSVWDSNAEGIRGKWRVRKDPALGSRPVEDSSNADASSPEDSWKWWRSGPDDDDYAVDDDDDDDDEDSWFGLGNFDMSSAISMLWWMLPAAALMLPLFFGGPMFFMAAFAFFPLVRKLFGAALQGWNGSSKARRRDAKKAGFWKQSKFDSYMDSREESEFFATDVEDWETSLLRSTLNREANPKLGGWGEENDKMPIQKKPRRGKKKVALDRQWSRKEMPLFFRLLVALFPFLRSWGGFL